MFDANLRSVEPGTKINVRFWGKSGKNGIIAGTYTGRKVVSDFDGNKSVIIIDNPRFRKSKGLTKTIVCDEDTGWRWVTYEGHIEK